MPVVHQFSVRPEIPERLSSLEELALNLRWTWDPRAYKVFQHLDAQLLEKSGGNPVFMLRRISRERLEQAATEAAFLTHLDEAVADLRRYLAEPGWFQAYYPERKDLRIAYFCMEYGLTHCLPIYSGGLGVLAGDHLKAASALGIPLVAVGLLYHRGHFTQRLTDEYWQTEEYRLYDFSHMPIVPVTEGERWRPPGEAAAPPEPHVFASPVSSSPASAGSQQLKISVEISGRTVWARVWKAQVGRVSLYLLDSFLPENDLFGQRITGELYGGGLEERLAQELLLGIGGMRALKALGVDPQVCHLNEGHTVFASLERVREIMEREGASFMEARLAAGAGTLFTTHTTVPAGFDLFPQALIESYLGSFLAQLGLTGEEFMRMGRVCPDDPHEDFNVAVLALRHAPRRNAVSRLHRRATARMMAPGWPGFPLREIPVETVTNGVHIKSWVAPEMAQLFDHYLGPRWREDTWAPDAWQRVERIPDLELWHAHSRLRARLVAYAREQALKQRRGRLLGGGRGLHSGTNGLGGPLRPDVLTIGFARRFAAYKRADLIFRDVERLKRILLSETRPVQLIIAGKAHPRDGAGKEILRRILETVEREGLSNHVVFLEDYDLSKAAMLVQGVDVWLNTPRRPWEACGTSGMKAVPNGGLHLSVLDGWWAEAYRPGVGWAIGEGQEFVHADYQDEVDAESLYSLLENEVVPLFYERDADGLPRGWIAMMKNSIRVLSPVFSAERMLKQYTERFYLPMGERYQRVCAGGLAKAKQLATWRERVREAWPAVRISAVEVEGSRELMVGQTFEVKARIFLGALDPADVSVEAYVSGLRPDGTLKDGHAVPLQWAGFSEGEHLYRGCITAKRAGLQGFAVRVLPYHEDLLIPNELPLIAWHE